MWLSRTSVDKHHSWTSSVGHSSVSELNRGEHDDNSFNEYNYTTRFNGYEARTKHLFVNIFKVEQYQGNILWKINRVMFWREDKWMFVNIYQEPYLSLPKINKEEYAQLLFILMLPTIHEHSTRGFWRRNENKIEAGLSMHGDCDSNIAPPTWFIQYSYSHLFQGVSIISSVIPKYLILHYLAFF